MCKEVNRYCKGSIWYCNLARDEMLDYMQSGRRPVLVISDSEMNSIEKACFILPLTTHSKYEKYLNTHQVVKIELSKTSYIQCNMCRRVHIDTLKDYQGVVSQDVMDAVMTNYLYYLGIDYTQIKEAHSSISDSAKYNRILGYVSDINDTLQSTPLIAVKPASMNKKIFNTKTSYNLIESGTSHKPTEIKDAETLAKPNNVKKDIKKDAKNISNDVDTAKEVFSTTSSTSNKVKSNSTFKNNPTGNISKLDNTKIDNTKVEPIKHINRDPNARKRGSAKNPIHRMDFPRGYWKSVEHNIECWNFKLTHDVETCKKRYGLTTNAQWSKLVYRVHKFLNENGYTDDVLKNVIAYHFTEEYNYDF